MLLEKLMYKPITLPQKINDVIMEHYDLFSETGLLQYIQVTNQELSNRNELIDEVQEIFNKRAINELVHYITDRFINKFIPETLTFVISSEAHAQNPIIISYEKLKEKTIELNITNFKMYKDFFQLSPTSITFEAFEVLMDDEKYSDPFLFLKPELLVPIMGIGGTYGFLIIGQKVTSEKYEQNEINFIDQIMQFVSISLQNIIHYHSAITDLKTKLYNHDYFMQSFERELARMKRYGGETGLLILDIDHFKKVNDNHGHVTGDKIIQLVAKTVAKEIRGEDIPARFGGEEFVILLTECKKNHLISVAERIRKRIENYKIHFNNQILKITVSIGGIHIEGKNVEAPEKILKKADYALYYCKENGRNCSFLYNMLKSKEES